MRNDKAPKPASIQQHGPRLESRLRAVGGQETESQGSGHVGCSKILEERALSSRTKSEGN